MSRVLSRSARRAEHRRAGRRRTLRTLAILLALLALVAGGFAVYLAVDAPAPPALSIARQVGAHHLGTGAEVVVVVGAGLTP